MSTHAVFIEKASIHARVQKGLFEGYYSKLRRNLEEKCGLI